MSSVTVRYLFLDPVSVIPHIRVFLKKYTYACSIFCAKFTPTHRIYQRWEMDRSLAPVDNGADYTISPTKTWMSVRFDLITATLFAVI